MIATAVIAFIGASNLEIELKFEALKKATTPERQPAGCCIYTKTPRVR